MKLYEGKALMYASPAPRKNINIPMAILHAHDDSELPADDPARDDPLFMSKEDYDPAFSVQNNPVIHFIVIYFMFL